jgi:hypothetical protein
MLKRAAYFMVSMKRGKKRGEKERKGQSSNIPF